MWTLIHRQSPEQLLEVITINEDNLLTTRPPRLQTIGGGWRWRTVLSWNQLEPGMRVNGSKSTFKKQVKQWLIDKREPDPGLIDEDN